MNRFPHCAVNFGVRPLAFALAILTGIIGLMASTVTMGQCCDPCQQGLLSRFQRPCGCRLMPRYFQSQPCYPYDVYSPETYDPSSPGTTDPSSGMPGQGQSQPFGDLAMMGSGLGATRSDMGAGMGLVGDFFAGGTQMIAPSFGLTEFIPLSAAGGDRRYKLTENTSPFPTNRIFVNTHYFKHAAVTAEPRELSIRRTTLGLEKTFLGGMMSLEGRLPFAYGLDSTQTLFSNDNQDVEFGNMSLAIKALLIERRGYAIAAGLGIIFPTASDTVLLDQGGETILTVENRAFQFQPFIGVHLQPTDRLWLTAFTQVDLTCRGDRVYFGDRSSDLGGTYQDQNLLFVDAALGYWLFRDFSRPLVTGVAPIVELHYSSMMNSQDGAFDDSGTGITNPNGRMDLLNITGALRFQIRHSSFLTVSGVAPLHGGEERVFDSEIGVQFMRLY